MALSCCRAAAEAIQLKHGLVRCPTLNPSHRSADRDILSTSLVASFTFGNLHTEQVTSFGKPRSSHTSLSHSHMPHRQCRQIVGLKLKASAQNLLLRSGAPYHILVPSQRRSVVTDRAISSTCSAESR